MTDTHELVPIDEIKTLVDQLATLGLDPLHLNIDGRRPTDQRPNVSMWMRYRTDFETVCKALKLKAVERTPHGPGQRLWYAERDTTRIRLLVQCTSFPHHDDWQPRPEKRAAS